MAYLPDESYETYRPYLETRRDEICANIMLCLTNQGIYLLRQQLKKLTEIFPKTGGIRERMAQARMEYRRQQK